MYFSKFTLGNQNSRLVNVLEMIISLLQLLLNNTKVWLVTAEFNWIKSTQYIWWSNIIWHSYSSIITYVELKCDFHQQKHKCISSNWWCIYCRSWWHHQMETFSALLALCVRNSQVTGEFPTQRLVTRSFDVFFDLCLNKRLSKQSWGWWFETPSRSLWHHCNVPGKKWYVSTVCCTLQ